MRAPVVSRASKLSAAVLAFLLASMVGPAAMADELSSDSAAGGVGADVAATADAPMLASLMAGGAGRVNAAVALEDDPEPVVGSFTVGGLTYAIVGEGKVALVAVGPGVAALAAGPAGAGEGLLAGSDGTPSGEDSGSGVPPRSVAEQVPSGAVSPSSSPEGAPSDGAEGEDASEPMTFAVPESAEFDGVAYAVVAIGPRAFAGCDADVVTIPATVGSVDELAFRDSAVKAIEVADGNPTYSSYDGMLFDADQTSLLLIPEGKQGAARIPKTASAITPDAFSHCASVTSVEVEAGSAAYLSRNGCLYDAMGETLLHAPRVEDALAILQERDAKALPYIGRIDLNANGGLLESKMNYEDNTQWRQHGSQQWIDGAYGANWTLSCDGRFDYRPYNVDTNAIWAQWRVTRAGYAIVGWDGTHACLAGQTPYIEGTGDVKVTAVWRPMEFTVWLNQQGGEGGQATLRQEMDAELPSVAVPTKSGHLFMGYWDDPKGGNRYYDSQGDPVDRGEGYGTRWTYPHDATLFAHWVPLIAVDAPTSATFFADLTLKGQGSRDAQVQGSFGQARVVSQAKVPLQVAGLESRSGLGASEVILGASDGLLSVYPAQELLTAAAAQSSENLSAKPPNAVDFALDDTLVERDFEGKGFLIPTNGELLVGYRLNLSETGARIAFEKLPEGTGGSVSLATLSYAFAVAG